MAPRGSNLAAPGPATTLGADSRHVLAGRLLSGCKPPVERRTGVEIELFGFRRDDLTRIGDGEVEAILRAYAGSPAGLVSDDGAAIGCRTQAGCLSKEPGGQLEFSSNPHRTLGELEQEIRRFLSWLREIAEERGLLFLAIGYDPLSSRGAYNWVRKSRYRILRPYLQARGRRAWDMMCQTASIQSSLDFTSAEDMARKFILGNRLAPVATAIFANSPFAEGRLSEYKSERSAAWLETDRDRCGIAPLALNGTFSLDRFVEYVASVPMIFIRRNGGYLDVAGLPFRRFLESPAGLPAPILQDFTDHLTTVFTEARIKDVIELRSADCGGLEQMLAVPAFWKGLLYHEGTLQEALKLVLALRGDQLAELQRQAARVGLEAACGRWKVLDLAKATVELSLAGLKAIAPDEVRYLAGVEERVTREGTCPADLLIRNFRASWGGDIRRLLEHVRAA